jgi:phage terminase large subunit-like protein
VAEILAQLTDAEADEILHDWREFARPAQLAPPGAWGVWMFLAGRGAGKTRSGAEWVRGQVKAGCGRIALIAPTAGDARDVMVEGESGLLSVCWSGDKDDKGNPMGRPLYEPSKRRVTWQNGAIATLFSAEEPERLRGPQSDAMWADEVAAWNNAVDTWDMAMFGLRLGSDPRAMVTTTPKPVPIIRSLIADPDTVVTTGSTYDNASNLSAKFIKKIRDKYEGTRLGRQEINAELLDDVQGALWTRDMIKTIAGLPEMSRIVVAVDPSGASGQGDGDNIGIIVAGRTIDGLYHVIEDSTCNLSPAGWGRRACDRYSHYAADRIVAERNFGGAMVESTIKTQDPKAAVKLVTASRGKSVRAEPIAALYEQGKVTHARGLDQLENQMMHMTLTGYVGEKSPDRVDALVWALTDLALGDDPAPTGMILRKGRQR